MKFLNRKKQKGVTLIEFILVFGVFSLIMLSVYNLASTVTSTAQATSEAERINVAIEKIERVVGVSGTFEDVGMAVFNDLTENYVSNYDLESVVGDVTQFTINYVNITQSNCTKFAEKVLQKNENVNVRINNVLLPAYSSIDLIAAACAPDENDLSIIVTNDNLATLENLSTVNPVNLMEPNTAPLFSTRAEVFSIRSTENFTGGSRTNEIRDQTGKYFSRVVFVN